jgi:hypothetical protein
MGQPDADGQCRCSAPTRTAPILILDPHDWDSEDGPFPPVDPKRVLLHELLHLPFAQLDLAPDHDRLNTRVLERAIQPIGSALSRLDVLTDTPEPLDPRYHRNENGFL